MCKLKSAIILKDRVFVPDYDSHDKMLKELGIKDTRENAERLFVRAELSPKSRAFRADKRGPDSKLKRFARYLLFPS